MTAVYSGGVWVPVGVAIATGTAPPAANDITTEAGASLTTESGAILIWETP